MLTHLLCSLGLLLAGVSSLHRIVGHAVTDTAYSLVALDARARIQRVPRGRQSRGIDQRHASCSSTCCMPNTLQSLSWEFHHLWEDLLKGVMSVKCALSGPGLCARIASLMVDMSKCSFCLPPNTEDPALLSIFLGYRICWPSKVIPVMPPIPSTTISFMTGWQLYQASSTNYQ